MKMYLIVTGTNKGGMFDHLLENQNILPMWIWLLILILLILILIWAIIHNISSTEDIQPVNHEKDEPARKITPAASAVQKDDLKKIEGIGPKISQIFYDAGIKTFVKLAETNPATLQQILNDAGIRLNDSSTWPEQARLASEGKWEELERLQDRLKGGRYVD